MSRASAPPRPAYFRSLEIENVRCFGRKQTLDLTADGRPAKWTVLLGDNGVGKTTLLQCLYDMTPRVGIMFPRVDKPQRRCTPPRVWFESRLPSVHAGTERGRLMVELEVGRDLQTKERGNTIAASFDVHGTSGKSGEVFSVDELPPSLYCGYGASRRLGTGEIEARDVFDAAESLFSADVPLINAVEWLLQADWAAHRLDPGPQRARAHFRRDAVKRALVDLLPDVSAIREAGYQEDPPRPHVEVKTPYGWISLRDLSLGYQTMIAWIVDLASRMFDAYPDSENPLAEAAVVLVDEIDLHLHPRWQRQITGYLDRLFPNVQFIVTAHSPLVVQGEGVTNVAVLRRNGNEVEIVNDPDEVRGWRVDQILTSDLFGLESARAPEIEKLIDRQQELVLLDNPTSDDEAELRELDAKLAKLMPAGETARDRRTWSRMHEFLEKLGNAASREP